MKKFLVIFHEIHPDRIVMDWGNFFLGTWEEMEGLCWWISLNGPAKASCFSAKEKGIIT